MKGKEERKRYTQLNAEFQRIAMRDKKAFLNKQCTDIEENNPNSQRTAEQQRRSPLEVHRAQLPILDSQPTLRTSEATPGLLFVSNLAEVRASLVTQMVKNLLPAV